MQPPWIIFSFLLIWPIVSGHADSGDRVQASVEEVNSELKGASSEQEEINERDKRLIPYQMYYLAKNGANNSKKFGSTYLPLVAIADRSITGDTGQHRANTVDEKGRQQINFYPTSLTGLQTPSFPRTAIRVTTPKSIGSIDAANVQILQNLHSPFSSVVTRPKVQQQQSHPIIEQQQLVKISPQALEENFRRFHIIKIIPLASQPHSQTQETKSSNNQPPLPVINSFGSQRDHLKFIRFNAVTPVKNIKEYNVFRDINAKGDLPSSTIQPVIGQTINSQNEFQVPLSTYIKNQPFSLNNPKEDISRPLEQGQEKAYRQEVTNALGAKGKQHSFPGLVPGQSPRLRVPPESEVRFVVDVYPVESTNQQRQNILPTTKPADVQYETQSNGYDVPAFDNFLSILKETNKLPKNLTPENIDNGIRTLAFILQRLQQEKQVESIQTSFNPKISTVPAPKEFTKAIKKQPDGGKGKVQSFPQASGTSTPGRPGIDYPTYSSIPQTKFDCSSQRYKGFFGDPDTKCQVWHYCDLNGGQASFLCPNGTIFSQVALTCDWWFNVKCASTSQLYVLNERLYKYILPFSPSFPEDYSGPVVDRYLTAKFNEMERKSKIKALKGLTSTTTTTSTEKQPDITPQNL